jgi:hypothetical protein
MTLASTNEPFSMAIDHSKDGTGVNVTDRHRVLFERTRLDSTGVLRKISCNVAIAVDRAGEFTTDEAVELVALGTNFFWGISLYDELGAPLSTDVVEGLMRGES